MCITAIIQTFEGHISSAEGEKKKRLQHLSFAYGHPLHYSVSWSDGKRCFLVDMAATEILSSYSGSSCVWLTVVVCC